MGITNETRDSIAKFYIGPIFEQLAERASEEVVENFCKPRCGHAPEGNFCHQAQEEHKHFLYHCIERTSRLN